MLKMVTSARRREYLRVVGSVAAWATQQPDVIGVAVVGSWARGQARMDSNVDLVVFTDDKDHYIADGRWVPDAVGEPAELVRTQHWGR
jgi:uncharacterized protein